MPDTPFPLQLRALDQDRLRRYRERLAFYEGDQWAGRARRGERRLVLNYARAFVDKITSYLFEGHALQVRPHDPLDRAAAERARAAERAWRAVEAANGLARLDFETELDCAVLGDAAYKVTWDVEEGRVRISAPDVQGVYVWRAPDDGARVEAVASQYAAGGAPPDTASPPLARSESGWVIRPAIPPPYAGQFNSGPKRLATGNATPPGKESASPPSRATSAAYARFSRKRGARKTR